MTEPESSLAALVALLREEPVIAPHLHDSDLDPALGRLAASGPRAAEARAEYLLLVEAIREGYLLHYGEPRLIDGADPDLRLLTGDYLYALGLERLAARGDLESVRELADLISLCAQLDAEEGASGSSAVAALWLATAVAVGAGGSEEHEQGKRALRAEGSAATEKLVAATRESANGAGMGDELARAADSIGFAAQELRERG